MFRPPVAGFPPRFRFCIYGTVPAVLAADGVQAFVSWSFSFNVRERTSITRHGKLLNPYIDSKDCVTRLNGCC